VARSSAAQSARSRKRWGDHAQRFWSRVDKTGSCWLWLGARNKGGYGHSRYANGRNGDAHRVAWTVTNGDIPDGLMVLHSCDNRLCVNPAHLFLGTQLDNMRDMDAKGRRRTVTHDQRGELNGTAKLTKAIVLSIRELHESGISQREIGRKLGVTAGNVWAIVHRKSWNHI